MKTNQIQKKDQISSSSDRAEVEESQTLVQKLAGVMGEITRVGKKGRNNFHNYDYAMESDILDEVREKLARRNIFITTSVESIESRESGRKTREGNPIYLTFVRTKHVFRDGESGETIEVMGYGSGEDMGDKGIYKAITGAMKYFVSKNFLISTGDDPEKDEEKEIRTGDSKLPGNTTQGGGTQVIPPDVPRFQKDPVMHSSANAEPNTAKDFIKEILVKTGPKRDGTTYSRYSIETLWNGFFTTFNQSLADVATEAKNSGSEVVIQFKQNGRWKDIQAIRTVEESRKPVEDEVENLPF